jgi:hypothetical protein
MIEVLLATYNGEKFLRQQLDSLLAQDCRDFTVIASDDSSSDGTRALLDSYSAAHPGFLRLLDPVEIRLGASANFARLLDIANADYVFFCDQDDVWLPTKISMSMALMAEQEATYGPGLPIVVHTDLIVVDAELNRLSNSFMRYSGIDPRRNHFGALLLGNIVTGCTAVANRALYELARPIPREALMFDHWLAQVAAGLGRIAYLDIPTLLYRQHQGNLVGARRAGTASFIERVNRTVLSNTVLFVLSRFSQAAAVLSARYGERLAPKHARQALAIAHVWERPRYQRFLKLICCGLRKPSLATNLGLFALLLRNRPTTQGTDRK